MAKDRARDPHRQANIEWTKQDRMEQKYGYELANPEPDTHEAEYDAANKRL